MIEQGRIDTAIGPLQVLTRNRALVLVDLDGDAAAARAQVLRRYPDEQIEWSTDPGGCTAAFQKYFSGDLTALDSLAVDPGGTPFQASVWLALREIRPGTTISYRDLADRIGAPNAVRAVGAANGANPIPIVIPCHRVIGASGKLVGYGGGLDKKAWLLRHEGWRPLAP
jgi:methylated-DNA-[protein]-cysteine S-methyltransferase